MQDAAYRTLINLDAGHLTSHGRQLKLVPGMQVSAEIHLGTRSVIEYLLSPVQKVAPSLTPSPSISLIPSPSPEWRRGISCHPSPLGRGAGVRDRGEMKSAKSIPVPISRKWDRSGAGEVEHCPFSVVVRHLATLLFGRCVSRAAVRRLG